MKRPLVIAVATVGVLATAAFVLPELPPNAATDAVKAQLFKEKEKSFSSAADAPRDSGRSFALPAWVPQDATHVKVKIRTNGEGRLIRFTLGSAGFRMPPCDGRTQPVGAPALRARWWPSDARHDARPVCGDAVQYQVVVRGKRVYAWTNGEASPEAGKAATAVPSPGPAAP
ncbi:hypothetical protein [Streptomyces antimicrobicus]|uniref:Secreted protein n=1 Tax=Streptomyces antimicrobicus TaxID=2883108 RepID=A0ABS8B5H7_9ACTN|nr:hypothetical protein [Streptomyces antimicrobicus]MCB5179847.1 hypothetical protein [Streptomyces antimicrobicus]